MSLDFQKQLGRHSTNRKRPELLHPTQQPVLQQKSRLTRSEVLIDRTDRSNPTNQSNTTNQSNHDTTNQPEHRTTTVPLGLQKKAHHLLQQMNINDPPNNNVDDINNGKVDDLINDDDDFCFEAGSWDPIEINQSMHSPTPTPACNSPPTTPQTPQTPQIIAAKAKAALSLFVGALFARKSNLHLKYKAAENWCVYRGLGKDKASVVVSVARHLKDALVLSKKSRQEQNLEITRRLEHTFQQATWQNRKERSKND